MPQGHNTFFLLLPGRLSAGGRHQPYYHVLVDHRDRPFQSTYVAQENIVRPTPTPTPSTPAEAGPSGEASEVTALLCLQTDACWDGLSAWLHA